MSFYEKVRMLCREKGFDITYIGDHVPGLNISRAQPTNWKNGAKPRASTVKPIADYFGVSVAYLLSDEEEEKKTETDDVAEYLEMLKNRSEMRMLFSVSKNATKEDIERAVRIIEALKEESGN